MKRFWILFISFTMLLVMGGCGSSSPKTVSRIVSPQNRSVPLQGKWVIEKCIFSEQKADTESSSAEVKQWTGKTAQFTENTAALDEYSWDNVNYKIKKVNAKEYFLYKYKGSVDELGIKEKDVYVITLSSADKFLYEFVKINDDEVIASIDDSYYCMEKVSDKTDDIIHKDIETSQDEASETAQEEKDQLRSGLLLGIRTPAGQTDKSDADISEEYNYRTLWIASINGELHPVLETDDIFLPRKSGFWRLKVDKKTEDGKTEDVITAGSISDDKVFGIQTGYSIRDFPPGSNGTMRKVILYAGNDYVSVESSGGGKLSDGEKNWNVNRLQTIPIDNITNGTGIKISDIAGENGTLAMNSAMNNALGLSNTKELKEADAGRIEDSFALFRKTGHWFVKGRLALNDADQVPYIDFNINLIPPKELVAYDTLHISWTDIKDKVPETLDAYTSPNKDIAVVLTRSQLLIYALAGDKLTDTPLKKVALHEGDSVVMAEWARGKYAESWEKTFIARNEVREVQ